ncbi:MAG: KUP/HAK/KT family potassium transporter [Nitrospirota bacterium]|nr:KUP/HAK/KT family potassium transporter [Nitrospirota bacterium]
MSTQKDTVKGIVQSLGLVFGDIGTSPIYTLTVVFLLTDPSPDHIIGVLSLIVWTLIILVTIEYAWLAMSLGHRGEGGTIVLREILTPLLTSPRQRAFVTALSFAGIALIIGDGVITPAISILSAVEGALLIPGLELLQQNVLIAVAAFIAIVLFSVQRKGTDKVAGAFGPIMVIWFCVLALSGLVAIVTAPSVLKALNPLEAVHFLSGNVMTGFLVLSEVILCATGGEALYADMGHLGRKPIIRAWNFVFIALVINYLGQGAYLMHHPHAKFILFEMVRDQVRPLYIPFLLLSIMATVIASQAMISGMFSIVYQGISTRIMPMFRISFTSRARQSQIYIGFVNWFLLGAVLSIMFLFQRSSNLAAAYGLAVTGTMTLTGFIMTWIFLRRSKYWHAAVAIFVTAVNVAFLVSNTYKIPHGGYWSLIIAAVPLFIIVLYTRGQKQLYLSLQPLPRDVFLLSYGQIYAGAPRIRGTALFFAKDTREMPPYLVHAMFKNGIVYEDNIIVSIVRREDPFGVTGFFKEDIAPGLRAFEIQMGYMEIPDVEEILREAGITERAIFYGVEDISTANILWQLFSVIKKLTPTIVQFYRLPSNKLHGVVTRVEM